MGNRALLSWSLFRNLLISYLVLSGAQRGARRILEHPLQSAIKTNEELLYRGLNGTSKGLVISDNRVLFRSVLFRTGSISLWRKSNENDSTD